MYIYIYKNCLFKNIFILTIYLYTNFCLIDIKFEIFLYLNFFNFYNRKHYFQITKKKNIYIYNNHLFLNMFYFEKFIIIYNYLI